MYRPASTQHRFSFHDDRAYHELRVLLLIHAVSEASDGPGHVDGLGQLAKLDFLVRYPLLAAQVLDDLDPHDPRLHPKDTDVDPVKTRMHRHGYGPWQERYYTVVGALLGRGLLTRTAHDGDRITLRPSVRGTEVALSAARTSAWSVIFDRCHAVAETAHELSDGHIAGLIRERLALDEEHDFGDLIT